MIYIRKNHGVRRVGGWLLMWAALLWFVVEAGNDWVKEKTRQFVLWADLKHYEDWLRANKARWSAIPLFIVFLVGLPFKVPEVWLLYNHYWVSAILVFFFAKTLLGGLLKHVAVDIYGERLLAINWIKVSCDTYLRLRRLLADRIRRQWWYQDAHDLWVHVRAQLKRQRSLWAVARRSARMHHCCCV